MYGGRAPEMLEVLAELCNMRAMPWVGLGRGLRGLREKDKWNVRW